MDLDVCHQSDSEGLDDIQSEIRVGEFIDDWIDCDHLGELYKEPDELSADHWVVH